MGESNGNRQNGQNQPLEKSSNSRNGKKVEPAPRSDAETSAKDSAKNKNLSGEVSGILDAFEFMKAEGLAELEFDSDIDKIRIKRKTDEADFAPRQVQKAEKEAEIVEADSIKSPLSGTFYAASKHGMPPYVSVGDTVDEGTTLCIVEAMKVMNEIKADAKYKIIKILATNAKPVSSGEALFLVKIL